MTRIAITGGVAEGKSTVLRYLQELGYAVESSDRIARQIFLSDEIQAELASLLGVATPVLPEQIRVGMQDDAIRRGLNALTHPRILAALDSSDAAFFEVPLLIEACLQERFGRVWVVTCGRDEQIRRLTERIGASAAEALIGTQLATRAKIPFGDRIVRTNQPESTVKRFVTEAAQLDLG